MNSIPRKLFWFSIIFIFCFTQTGLSVLALSPEQKRVLNSGVYYFDIEETSTGCMVDVDTSKLSGAIPEPHKTLFAQAAAAYKTNPTYIASLFLSEHANNWAPFDSRWATSPKGASGPFQFMPGTWAAYKVDGNNDGQADVMNIYDSAFAAANMAAANGVDTNTPLGDINTPFARGTLIFQAAVYNWGGGNVSKKTTDTSPISVAPPETQNYMQNVYSLISSGFTSGGGKYPTPTSSTPPSTSAINSSTQCSGGVVTGSIVQTALNFAWETGGHGPDQNDAKPEYRTAMPQYNGSTGSQPYSDCGVFTSTVMIATGADPNYPKRGTSIQENYVRNHTEKYYIIENIGDTSQLQPGDILIYSKGSGIGHTFIFTGSQQGYKGDSVSASLGGHVPQASSAIASITYNGRAGDYIVARIK